MTACIAIVMHGERDAEGRYEFELDGQIETMTPMKVVEQFMEHVDHDLFPKEHVEYECNAAFKSKDRHVVSAIGQMHFTHGAMPFLMMISRKA